MSRGWIIGIVCLAISSTSAPACHAQEGDSGSSSGALTLSERLGALRDKFRREEGEASSSDSSSAPSSRSSYGTPKKRNSLGSNTAQSSKRKSLLPSINPSALLQNSFFGHKDTDDPNDQHPQAYGPSDPVRVTKTRRAGSIANQVLSDEQVARKSPHTTRTNELEAALADLVPAEDPPATEQPEVEISEDVAAITQPVDINTQPVEINEPAIITSEPAVTSLPPTPQLTDTFDLHQALVGEMPTKAISEGLDEVASNSPTNAVDNKAAATSEETFFGNQKTATPPIALEQPTNITTLQQPVPTTKPFADLAEPTFASPSPVAAAPQPTYRVPPVAAETSTSNEAINEPFAQQNSSSDPFEAAAAEAFSSDIADNSAAQQSPFTSNEQSAIAEDHSSEEDVVLSYQQPVIVSHVKGPRRIVVGREATYQIILENTSSTPAKSLASSIRVPEWAEVVDVMSTSGVVERTGQEAKAGVLEWKLGELAAQSSETLRLKLIPRSGRPLQLGIQWSQAPMASETVVEVQEPKLEIEVSGPQEVLFGKVQRYRLTLSNPGTGRAEQVVITLIPPGGDAESATKQRIGVLKPGEVRNLDLELTAREAGELTIQASATAEGGLTAESVKDVLCVKPELQIDWRGPETKYAGTTAAYYFRVRNPGTASTEPLTVRVDLPEGAQFVAASDGHNQNSKTNAISWQLPSLEPGQEQFMQVRCKVDQPGANTFKIVAQTESGNLTDSKTINTNVVALADLKLEVSDPQGPIPMGESVLYEIRVRNRGASAAEGVSVIGLFSDGIDPKTVEGAQYTIRDGRVTFHPIQSLPAGQEVVLRIRAVANRAGTHLFRAEVICQDLDIKLAAEETTRFFEDEFRWEDSKTPYSAERNDSVAR